jgi:hypothetical protein
MIYTTSELPVAAFLKMKGVRLISASTHQGGKFMFKFDDSKSECESYALEFFNSEFCTFDAHLKSLKKIIYSRSQ